MDSLSVWIDESEKGEFLVVAGVLVPWDSVPSIVRGWRDLKEDFGLSRDAEIKWNVPSDHPTRMKIEELGKKTKDLLNDASDFITQQDELVCVSIAMAEKRADVSFWKKYIWSQASVRDFFCEGLKYLLQRVAEEVVLVKACSCVVICDTPELGKKAFTSGSIRRGRKAVEESCRDWYRNGVSVGPGKKHHDGPLEEIGFHPSILIGDATYHDMLQIADIVAGVTRAWIINVRDGCTNSWEVDRFKVVSSRFRRRYGSPKFFGDGFVLWPWDNQLWEKLQISIR